MSNHTHACLHAADPETTHSFVTAPVSHYLKIKQAVTILSILSLLVIDYLQSQLHDIVLVLGVLVV